MFPIELEIKYTTDIPKWASHFDLQLEIDRNFTTRNVLILLFTFINENWHLTNFHIR